jgi:hypothetical protein
MCQSVWMTSIDGARQRLRPHKSADPPPADFCIFAPPFVQEVGESEERAVAWCTKVPMHLRLLDAFDANDLFGSLVTALASSREAPSAVRRT